MMKNIPIILILICFGFINWRCTKKPIDLVGPTSAVDGFAYLKIGHFSTNFKNIVGSNKDSFNVYVNGNKINGAFMTYGSIFPSTANLYAKVPAGSQLIRLTLNGAISPDSLTLVGFSKNLIAGNYYSLIMNDSLFSPNESKQMFIQDNFSIADSNHFTVRLIHAILNDSAGKNIDVYSTRLSANMFSNISPGTITPYITEPYNVVADTLIVRRAGSLFELARYSTVNNTNGVLLARQRAFTLLYKGTPVNTGTKPRSLINFANL